MYEDAHFVPPSFPLYEYVPPEDDVGVPGRRWFGGWNGQIGAPADEVFLAWSRGDRCVLVATSGERHDVGWARFLALHVAIGNNNFPSASRHYRSSQERTREMEMHRDANDEWGPSVDGDPDAVVTTYRPDFMAGYKFVDGGTVLFVANEHVPLRVQIIADPLSYDLDPTRRFPLQRLRDRLATEGY